MFGLAQAVVLEGKGRGCMPGKGAGEGGFPPGLVVGRAGGEDRRSGHLAKCETLRIEDEKTGVAAAIVSPRGGQKRPVGTVKGLENRLIVGNRGRGEQFCRSGER